MAVAVKNEAEVGKGMPLLGLPVASLFSTAYVVLGILAVYHGIPILFDAFAAWWVANVSEAVRLGGFTYEALKLFVAILGAIGLIWLWPRLAREQPGLRAGVAVGTALAIAGLAVVYWVTSLVCRYLLAGAEGGTLYWGGLAAAVGTGLAWLVGMAAVFSKPKFQAWLISLEEQGWFTLKPYKKGQGLRVRRGTMLGVLAIVGAGLWEYVWSRSITVTSQWRLTVPFDPERFVIVMYAPALTLSILIAVLAVWFSYRLVNYPRFADFLIATDAELNKVSWSTPSKLFQDTIVVLVTVLLMAVFLWIMDLLWTFLLFQIGVLR
ncbi:MAG: preprotein translocase subunit SecE [Gemmatales bacterium]|nr:preprotein translocase subunit SecE [Gemmatales bacterium]MDW8386793.1 preprotein translocase subunit SecE [Gemmatales bacterium]